MAEYFPLLDRAVSGLPDQTSEARRSIYDRARAALIGQLRSIQPPIDEANIERENQALDEAIARIEARYSEPAEPQPIQANAAAMPEPARPRPTPSERPRPTLTPRPPVATPAADVRAPGLPTGKAPPVVPPPIRDRPPPRIPRPPLAAAAAGARAETAAKTATLRPVMTHRPGPPAKTDPSQPVTDATPDSAQDLDEIPTLPPAGGLPVPHAPEADFGATLDRVARGDTGEVAEPVRPRDPGLRPQAPRPVQPRRLRPSAIAAALLIVALMIGVGIAAWRLRDRPDQMTTVTQRPTQGSSEAQPGKIVERAGRPADAAAQPDEDATAGGATLPAPVGSNASSGDQAGSPSSGATVDAGIAVAQRAALLVDAPEDPQKVKTYPGTVVWHVDSVSPGQGQPLEAAVKAEIDIPDAKLKVTMLMQKNPEPQLPASHTIEFHFLPQPGNTLGNVKQINVPEMRKDDDAQTGDPLVGVPVAITENYFLVGLSRGAAESQNLRMIMERNWLDLSVLFAPNKLGKITFEKGASGQHVLEEATKAWH